MDQQTLIYIVVGASFALYLGIAIYCKAGSTREFYVASKGVHPVANGMATAADWMSAASFISMAGLIAFLGYGGSVFLMGWTGGFVLLAMLLAPYLRKFGKFTVPEFLGDRYYSNTARVIGVICLILASLTYVIGQMTGTGVAFSRFLEVSYEMGLSIGMLIVFFYAVMGGMKGITYTQIAQYCVMITAYTVPAVFISLQMTGWALPQIGLGSTLTEQGTFVLDRLDQVLNELGFAEYVAVNEHNRVNMFFYTLSLMIGTAGLPHVIIRFFTVPTVKAARSSAGWALVFIAILYTTAPTVGAMARLNLMETFGTTEATEMVYEERPQWVKNWEQTGLIEFTDKDNDGTITYSSNEEENEVTELNRDIIVLANPEIAMLPDWVIAIVAAGGIASALSTAAGLLLAISSAVSHDLLKGVFKPDISEKSELMAGRISMAASIAVAGYLGFNPPGFAAGTVALAFGLAAASLFPALMFGIFYKKMNKEGAIAGMLAGLTVNLLYVFQHKGIMFVASTSFLGDLDPNWFFGISPNAFGAVGAIVNFIVAMAVCKMTPEPPANIQHIVDDVRVPVGSSLASGGH
ncbi:cation acetate symporter [Halovibrio salipaludis]|uniref:Cation acetate symporter n=1 Tax=Halovibrio salipaludis TaxID=2032626 RepID=A0A2A2FCJ4_9GAMM|nr:sodium:solute symporter family protein [Halovibrio salipaludis]PAU82407.1 cation acetate symporter [Halovibrio salipaludis]